LERKYLEKVNRGSQLICFLSGFGGSGKSRVIVGLVRYASSLCNNLKIRFDRRTIVVTALTGAAAVSINGETSHAANAWNRAIKDSDIEDWRHTYMFILDEISFASRKDLETCYRKCCELKENSVDFGGIDIIFAGDFSQLKPVRATPLYLEENFPIWEDMIHTFFELKTSHRFNKDPPWGKLLSRYRDIGPTIADVKKINKRLIGSEKGPSDKEIPQDAVYATKTNIDRAAINDGIFANHLANTHSTNPSMDPPKHTICIKASMMQWHMGKKKYKDMNKPAMDIFYACVGEGHAKTKDGSKHYDPLLKLYYKRPVMMNENADVGNCEANGTMCEFEGIVFRDGVDYSNLEKIVIDGYWVWCVSVCQIQSIKLRVLDGLEEDDEIKYVHMSPINAVGIAHFPVPLYDSVDKNTPRIWRGFKFKQFPLNVANARTIHKLQGRSIENLVISTWDYTDNWIYVALSRVKTLKGLFLRNELDYSKCRGMSNAVQTFMEKLRKKAPLSDVEIRE